jgi:hypothetical protein
MITRGLLAGFLVLAALTRSATAAIIPPPLTATFINFDDIPGPQDIFSVPGPLTSEFASRGVIFSGFGQNGGALLGTAEGTGLPELSPPNFVVFISAFPMQNGGLPQTPEILSFYPPVTSVQFDTGTGGIDCSDPGAGLPTTMILTVQGFGPGSTPVGSITRPASLDGATIQITFSAPAEVVRVTSTHTCGPVGFLFHGVEIFTIDNLAFTPVASAASSCAQLAMDAAGKKAKAVAGCYAKALQKGLPVDDACIQKAVDNFNKGFTKAQAKGDCLTPDTDAASVEAAVDSMLTGAIQTVTNGSPGPDVCFGKKVTAIGKKAQAFAKCFSKAAKAGVQVDETCGQKAASSFNGSLKACGTPTQLGPIEAQIDAFGTALSRSLTVPTTTTTTTTTSTTTTTLPPPLGQHLSFTTTAGTANCGANGFGTPADPPFSGELDSDLVGTKLVDLGLGCLYIGGGAATVNPSLIPENATTVLDSPDGTTLAGSLGTGRADCSVGPQGSTKHCVNNPPVECTSDGDCFAPGGCQTDATCYFGPPVLVNGFPSSCVVNAFAQSASGTLNLATGESTVDIELSSFVYLTLGQPTVCPICDGGFCNYGANAGQPCTTTNSTQTTLDCLPNPGTFVATLPVSLNPLTSSTITATAADGLFCPAQGNAGAFGQAATQAITQNGSPAGDLTDGAPHAGVLVSNFCIPPTGSLALDGLADLPGPGSLSLPGNAQFFAVP